MISFALISLIAIVALTVLQPLHAADGDVVPAATPPPAAIPSPTAPPAVPASPPPPAAPAVPVESAATSTLGTEPPPLAMETPIVYAKDGQDVQATLADLISAHDKLSGLGEVNLEQVQDVMAAMSNDPAAQKRLLQSQLDKLSTDGGPPASEAEAALQNRIAQLEAQSGQHARVVATVEEERMVRGLETALKTEKVAEAFPYLAAKPEVGVRVARQYIRDLQSRAKAVGQDLAGRNDLFADALRRADRYVGSIATAYGGGLPAATAPAATDVVAEMQPGAATPPGMIRPAMITPEQMLADRQAALGGPGAAPPAPLSREVPEAGGVAGGQVPAGSPVSPAGALFGRDALKDKLRAQRAQQ